MPDITNDFDNNPNTDKSILLYLSVTTITDTSL